jgi:tyrosyl-tRNA synthetase
LHAGRKIQEFFGQKPQDIMTTQMLLGLDGRKMSTSWGNVINIDDSPDEQYGKIMSMRDEMIEDYFYLVTDLDDAEIKKIMREIKANKINPRDAKKMIAFNLVSFYWGKNKAIEAQEKFEKLFSKKEIPQNIPVLKIKKSDLTAEEIVFLTGALKSKNEVKRLIIQGGFDINNQKILNPKEIINLKSGDIIKIGKYRFFKVENEK